MRSVRQKIFEELRAWWEARLPAEDSDEILDRFRGDLLEASKEAPCLSSRPGESARAETAFLRHVLAGPPQLSPRPYLPYQGPSPHHMQRQLSGRFRTAGEGFFTKGDKLNSGKKTV